VAPRDPQRSLTDPGALLATTHEAGGRRLRLRLTRPSDAIGVRAFLEALSHETRRRRFLTPSATVSESMVRHFTFFDPRQRLVVAATTPDGGAEQILGLADVALLHTGLAEIAVVVADNHQGRGVGGLLTEAIASVAARQGATHLKAELLPENRAMMRLMERIGPTVRTFEEGGMVAYARLPATGRHAA
jgi:RimJ/RimL family protein N-acetyltransferase